MSVRYRLECDIRSARGRIETLRRQMTRAERALELRIQEIRDFDAKGTIPKRKRLRDEIADDLVWAARRQGLVVSRKRGRA